MALRDRSFPPPISIWAGLHAPGENILEEYREAQGRDRVQAFNRDIKVGGELRTKEIAIGDGGMRVLEFYNVSRVGYGACWRLCDNDPNSVFTPIHTISDHRRSRIF